LSYTPRTPDVLADDVLVTSGIDGTYPPASGGQGARIEQDAAYSRLHACPTAGTDQNGRVLVLSRQ